METVTVGSTIVKKSNHCKYLGVTIDKHLGFQTQVEKVLKNIAVGIKTVETVQHSFPTGILLMLFHALVTIHFSFCSKLVLLYSSHRQTDELGFEERVFLFKSQAILRIEKKNKSIISIRHLIMFKSLIYLFQYNNSQKNSQNQLKLPTATYRWNSHTNQVVYVGTFSSVSTSFSSFFHYTSLKWNPLSLHKRDPSVSLHVFKS